jgi:hypothetical protein
MRRNLILVAVTLVCAVTVTGCSHASGPQVATAASHPQANATSTDTDSRLRQYAACLRQHGLHVDDPAPGQAGVRLDPQDPPETAAAAVQACMAYATGGDAPTPPSAAQLAQLRKYAGCMRDHGVSAFPDPDPQTGFFSGLDKSNYDPSDPTVKAALAACQALAPSSQAGG